VYFVKGYNRLPRPPATKMALVIIPHPRWS
jgi:hypothetical protein